MMNPIELEIKEFTQRIAYILIIWYVLKLLKNAVCFIVNFFKLSRLWRTLPGSLNPFLFIQNILNFERLYDFQKDIFQKYPSADFVKLAIGPSPEIYVASRKAYNFLFFQKNNLTLNPNPGDDKAYETMEQWLGPRAIPMLRKTKCFPTEQHYYRQQISLLEKVVPKLADIKPGNYFFEAIWKNVEKANSFFIHEEGKINILDVVNNYAGGNLETLLFGDLAGELKKIVGDEDYMKLMNDVYTSSIDATKIRMGLSYLNMLLPFPMTTFVTYLGKTIGSSNKKYKNSVDAIKKYIQKIISHMQNIDLQDLDSKHDLCSVYLREIQWDNDLLESLIFAMSLGARNAVAASNPNFQQNLYQELITYFSSTKKNLKALSASELDSLPFLNGIVREAGRLNPPVAQGYVFAADDLKFTDGTLFPKGTKFTYCPFAFGNLEKNYTDVNVVKPERWIKGVDAVRVGEDPFPLFKVRDRNCVGMDVGFFQVKLFLAKLILKFELNIDPKDKENITKSVGIHLVMANKKKRENIELMISLNKRKEFEHFEVVS
eukprot:snap_masked-scaffold_2-processed-gene-13.4-mRNA-1 protein AED:1.00 eAED:1.00 QI:0/0/0/0/1/1/2/0/544